MAGKRVTDRTVRCGKNKFIKKNTKRNTKPTILLIKEQKQISTRLMQISLKVDDYIYKQVPISVKNAVMFIKEVTGYEDECFEDKRALQVIEKLVQCLKGIIAEQEEGCSAEIDDVTLIDVDNILAWPIDNNLTQFNQEMDADKILKSQKNNIKLINLCDKPFLNEKVITDLCNDERDKNKRNQEDRHLNENLQRAICNLSIRCEVDPLSNLEDFSERILNGYDCSKSTDDGKRANKNKSIFSQDIEEVIQPATISKEIHKTGKKNSKTVTNVSQPRITKTRSGTQLPNVSNSDPIQVTVPKAKNNCKTKKNYTKEKVQRKRQKENTKYNKKNKERNKQTAVAKNKQKKIKVDKQIDIKTTDPEKDHMTFEKLYKGKVAKKTNKLDVNRRWNDNCNARASAEILSNQKSIFIEKTASNPVYTKHVENDLSWIDKITYVREITQDENIPAYFEDRFWDNYTLPYDWNNDEFI